MAQALEVKIDDADAYLKQAYARVIIPESDGSFRGEIIEFPGCIATGETPTEALESLESAARDWLLASLANKQNIPQPIENYNEYSGRLVLRLPKSLHKKSALVAEREGSSLNQFIVYSIAEAVGESNKNNNVFVSIYANPLQVWGQPLQHTILNSGADARNFPIQLVPVGILSNG